MASKNIIVTGATGYIGGTFAYEAIKKGHHVIGIDNFSNSSPEIQNKLSKFNNFNLTINCQFASTPLLLSFLSKEHLTFLLEKPIRHLVYLGERTGLPPYSLTPSIELMKI